MSALPPEITVVLEDPATPVVVEVAEVGLVGPAGADGADGVDGADGLNGADGADGTAAVAAHEVDTTNVHGIADTAQLETKTGAQAKADAARVSAQATAQGYTDTAVTPLDARLDALESTLTTFLGTPPAQYDTWAELLGRLDADDTAVAALTTAVAGKQAASATLTALAALTTTTFGRSLLTTGDAVALRAVLGMAAVAVSGSVDDLAESSTRKVMTAAERTKLAGIASAATANATDAQLRDRATHTGTQPPSSISPAYTVASGRWLALQSTGTGSTALTANVLYCALLDLPSPIEVDVFRCEVVTAVAATTLRVGFYPVAADGLVDFANLLKDLGTVDSSTTGLKDITGVTGLVLPRGPVYLAFVASGAVTVRTVTSVLPLPVPAGVDPPTGNANATVTRTGVTGALPSTGTMAALSATGQLKAYVKQR